MAGERLTIIRGLEDQRHLDSLKGLSLWGSDAYVAANGAVLLTMFPPVRENNFSPKNYRLVYDRSKQTVSSAIAHATRKHEAVIHPVGRNSGGIYGAIGMLDAIMESPVEGVHGLGDWMSLQAAQFLDVFPSGYLHATEEEKAEIAERTEVALQGAHLNLNTVLQKERGYVGAWIPRKIFGSDPEGKRERLIESMALASANRIAVELEVMNSDPIASRYLKMRQALRFEEQLSRVLFEDVSRRFHPDALPADPFFALSDSPVSPKREGEILNEILTSIRQLEQPKIIPFFDMGQANSALLMRVNKLIRNGQQSDETVRLFMNFVHMALAEPVETGR